MEGLENRPHFTHTSFGFETPNCSIQATETFLFSEVSESSALAFNILLVAFSSYFFQFFHYSLHFCFLCSSSNNACFTGVSVNISYSLYFLMLLVVFLGPAYWNWHIAKGLNDWPGDSHKILDIKNYRGARSKQVGWRRGGSPQVSWKRVQLESSRSRWNTCVWTVSDLWGCIFTLLKNVRLGGSKTCRLESGLKVFGCCSYFYCLDSIHFHPGITCSVPHFLKWTINIQLKWFNGWSLWL